jgi:hypothetical protein
MPTQIRIYTINRGQLQQFAKEWDEKIRPLRESLGFKVSAAWILEETNQFVWILSYDGPEQWDTLDAAYYASPTRLQMDPNPARLIARAEEYIAETAFQTDLLLK